MTTGPQANYAARVRAAGAFYKPLTGFNDRDYVAVWTWRNVDLTGAAFRGQVRARPDAAGDALGSFVFTAELIGDDTVVTGTLARAVIAALPAPPEPGTASLLYYDMSVQPAGGIEKTFMAGEFYRAGSVTA